jgi:hypothetical protein
MHQTARRITLGNVEDSLRGYVQDIQNLGGSIAHLRGLPLLEALKRKKIESGPYPHVSLFEAANRIMTDLVILHGVRWLLANKVFPFDAYEVEYGTDNKNGFDLYASRDGKVLKGEAFNVATSFFQTKKSAMLGKLRAPDVHADYKIVMFNHDAVEPKYLPKMRRGEFFVFVDVGLATAKMIPKVSVGLASPAPRS